MAAFVGAVKADPWLALLVAIVLAMPLEATRPWFPTGSLDLARIGMIAGIVAVVVRALRRRPLVAPPRPLAAAVLAILAVTLVSTAVFRWPGALKWDVAVVGFAAFSVFVLQAVRDARALRIVLGALLVAAAIQGAILVAEQAGDFYIWVRKGLDYLGRRNGTFVDPNLTARMLLVGLAAGFGWEAMRAPSRGLRALWAAGSFVAGFGLVLTLSRTGWLIIPVLVLVWIVGFGLSPRRVAGPAILLAAFAVGLVAVPNALGRAADVPPPDEGQVFFQEGPTASRTDTFLDPLIRVVPLDEVRRYLARAGTAMFQDHPLFGVGVAGFQPEILGEYRLFIPSYRTSNITSLPHTDVIRAAAEEGIVGLAALGAFLLAIAAALRAARGRAPRPGVWAVGLGIVATFIGAQAEGRFYTDGYLWLLVGLAAAMATFPALDDRVPAAAVPATADPATPGMAA